jgi:hypothetical protein
MESYTWDHSSVELQAFLSHVHEFARILSLADAPELLRQAV